MPKSRELARDPLGNLFRSQRPAGVDDLEGARQIKVSLLASNPYQPRTHFDQDKLAEMAQSIKRRGVIQPLLVRRNPDEEDDARYQIAVGERRWRAALVAGIDTIPCIVRDLDNDAMEEIALIENIDREDLTPVELARALKRLLERRNVSMRSLSEDLGKNHSYVEDRIKVLDYPEVLAALEAGQIGHTVALELTELDDADERHSLLARVASGERIRVRDVKDAMRPTRLPVKPAAEASREHNGMQTDVLSGVETTDKAAGLDPLSSIQHLSVPVKPADTSLVELATPVSATQQPSMPVKPAAHRNSAAVLREGSEDLARVKQASTQDLDTPVSESVIQRHYTAYQSWRTSVYNDLSHMSTKELEELAKLIEGDTAQLLARITELRRSKVER